MNTRRNTDIDLESGCGDGGNKFIVVNLNIKREGNPPQH